MNFKLIVAVDKNNGIGKNNKIPWYFSEDLKYFAKITKGTGNNAIIMGRKTYESIGNYPLPKRTNIIISSSYKNIPSSKHKFVTSPEEAINFCTTQKFDEVWIIGGATIYDYFLTKTNLIDEIYLTYIDQNYLCDTFFPEEKIKEYSQKFMQKIKKEDTNLFFYKYIKE